MTTRIKRPPDVEVHPLTPASTKRAKTDGPLFESAIKVVQCDPKDSGIELKLTKQTEEKISNAMVFEDIEKLLRKNTHMVTDLEGEHWVRNVGSDFIYEYTLYYKGERNPHVLWFLMVKEKKRITLQKGLILKSACEMTHCISHCFIGQKNATKTRQFFASEIEYLKKFIINNSRPENAAERKARPVELDPCRVWTGIKRSASDNTPIINYSKIRMSVARILWEITNGKVLVAGPVQHLCGNGLCINLSHVHFPKKIVTQTILLDDVMKTEHQLKMKNGSTETQGNLDTPCWIWNGSLRHRGYGQYTLCGKQIGAHCASHLVYNGPITKGMIVCHKCTNKGCVNPAHVELGTHKDNNTRDKIRDNTLLTGESHPNSKINEDVAKKIIKVLNKREETGASVQNIANHFNVAYTIIYSILNGKTWKHLPR